jgi:hypothetical protein
MRTVAQILSAGIAKVDDLRESLQLAAQLEFSTIPPYLCAKWSIRDPGEIQDTIDDIVIQEMGHMALTCNMLTAIGGSPSIANASFVPSYRVSGLPGNVHPDLVVDLLPLNTTALDSFIAIEKPEFTPLALAAAQIFPTIGDFYDAITTAFQTLQPAITAVHQVTNARTGAFPITSIGDALKAVNQIKEQGEGTQTTPFAADFDPNDLAHYYRFKEIREGHKLQKAADGTFKFDGAPIAMPQVFPFAAADPSATLKFNTILSDLLRLLEKTWTVNASNLGSAIGMMFSLADEGTRLIAAGIRPDFKFTSQSNLSHAASSLALRAVAPVTTRSRRRPRVMRVNTRQGSPAESLYRAAAGLTPAALIPATLTQAVPVPEAIAPGLRPTPAHDLVFRNGATITDLLYFNLFVGGQASWDPGDISNIETALLGITTDRQLNNVMQQYFTHQITCQSLGSEVLNGRRPSVVSQGDVEDLLRQLATAGKLQTSDPTRTVFNFFLPSGVVLNDDPGVTSNQLARRAVADRAIPDDDDGDSTQGLGGYHGSVHVGSDKFYYAIGVFSEVLPDGTRNGIPVFDQPWKNIVATFYHELQEARTDPDVEDAIRTSDDSFLGWTSRQGEECGDFPVFEAKPLTLVFQEVSLENGGTAPVQFQYSNAVHGPEGPIPKPH